MERPSDRPPVLTPKELALAAASDPNGSAITGNANGNGTGNGQALGYNPNGGTGDLPGSTPAGDE